MNRHVSLTERKKVKINNMKKVLDYIAAISTCSFILTVREACSKILEYDKTTDTLSLIMTVIFCICICVFIRKGADEL